MATPSVGSGAWRGRALAGPSLARWREIGAIELDRRSTLARPLLRLTFRDFVPRLACHEVAASFVMRYTHMSAPHWAGPCAVRALAVVVVVVALTRAAAGSVDRSRTHWVGKRVTLRVSDEHVADASWEVFYEPRTGRPYYHSRECV